MPPDHPPIPAKAPPTADALLEQLEGFKGLEGKEKSFEVASAMAKLFYQAGKHAEAVTYFRQAFGKALPLRMQLAALTPKAKRPIPAGIPAGCPTKPDATLDEKSAAATKLVSVGEVENAIGCLRGALKPAGEAQLMLSQALFLSGQAPEAVKSLDDLLRHEADNTSAIFARAAIRYETAGDDLAMLGKAREDLLRITGADPRHPRAALSGVMLARTEMAIAAGGLEKLAAKESADRALLVKNLPLDRPSSTMPNLTKEMVDAVENTERTPELEAGLAALVEEGEGHLAAGRYEQALDAYKRVVPFQPQNGRAKAGMAWSLVGLQKPTAERIWSVAVSGDPGAVDELGKTLAKKGDKKGAAGVWKKLAETAPEYAARAGLSERQP